MKGRLQVVKRRGVAALLVSLFPWFHAGDGKASVSGVDKVVVVKSERRMMLFRGGEVVKSYEVALGKRPVGPKMHEGDKRTPEGTYILDRRNSASRFYRSIHISYPNKADLENARKLGVSPGSDIIDTRASQRHGKGGELHTLTDWTNGCIAVTNAQMEEIWRLVPDGTPIEIMH